MTLNTTKVNHGKVPEGIYSRDNVRAEFEEDKYRLTLPRWAESLGFWISTLIATGAFQYLQFPSPLVGWTFGVGASLALIRLLHDIFKKKPP